MHEIPALAREIQLLVLDVDGVLTDGRIALDDHGVERKFFHVRDGAGLRIWQTLGYEVAIITGRSSLALRHRADELRIRTVHQGVKDKGAVIDAVRESYGLTPEQVAVVGDDLPDLAMMNRCGFPIAVADAAPEIRARAVWVTEAKGGHGAVRECVEYLLKARDRWEDAVRLYEEPRDAHD